MALAGYQHDRGVMEDTVEHGRGQDGVAGRFFSPSMRPINVSSASTVSPAPLIGGNADNAPCLAARCDMTHAVLSLTPKCETPNKKSRRLFWHIRFSLLLRSASVQTIGLVRSIALNRVGGF